MFDFDAARAVRVFVLAAIMGVMASGHAAAQYGPDLEVFPAQFRSLAYGSPNRGRLVQGPDGELYGVSDSVLGYRGVFRLSSSGAIVGIAMLPSSDPTGPPLIKGIDGEVYGFAESLGIFRVNPLGGVTSVGS